MTAPPLRATPLERFRRALPRLDLAAYHRDLARDLARRNDDLRFLLGRPAAVAAPASADGALRGVPLTVKDCLATEGLATTAGSRILEGHVPAFTATAVRRLLAAGAVLHGKTAMDEFGFGSFSLHCAYGAPRNPWDPERVAGGSSGGAAVATALLAHHVAVAESTGGSIACPAAFCGVVGLTPTYGRVSRWGQFDYASSLDKVGVMARATRDAFTALNLMGGPDPYDPTSRSPRNGPVARRAASRVGVVRDLVDLCEPPVRAAFERAVAALAGDGVEVREVRFPLAKEALAAYYVLACAEASTNLARYCGLRYGPPGDLTVPFDESFRGARARGFGAEAKRRILLGTYARMAGYRDAYYGKATRVRGAVLEAYARLFRDVDVLASPTMPLLPPRAADAERLPPVQVYALDALVVAPNLAGVPHLTVPCGTAEGLPVGMQFVANHWDEGALWDLGERWEARHAYRFPADLGDVDAPPEGRGAA